MQDLKKKLRYLPDSPGVYIMKDLKNEVLYVGKARSLKKRVKNYFGKKKDARNSILLFVPKIADIEHIVTGNEKEAFLLENNLIKKLKPKYNINLKDDKDFLCIRVNPKDNFPRLMFMRRPRRDGAVYFGPYSSAYAIKDVMRSLGRIFPLRRCSDHVFRNRSRPCILHQIDLCVAPCVGLITKEGYAKIVEGAIDFLKGNTQEIIARFKKDMKKASNEERYEDAAKYRDKIRAVDEAMLEQKVIAKDLKNRDIFGFARQKGNIAISLLTMRSGKISGGKSFKLKVKYLDDRAAFTSFLSQYYLHKATFVPLEILVPDLVVDKGLIEESLYGEGKHPRIRIPRRGEAYRLVKMAGDNAMSNILEMAESHEKVQKLLDLARAKLKLTRRPGRIEGYDISNISGKDATGAMVVFVDGEASKDSYKRFKMKFTHGPDDYSMMNEVLTRRLSNDELGPLPDLIVIDGGKGQLNIAARVLEEKSYEHIDLLSIAKEKRRDGKRVFDRIFVRGRKNPLALGQDSPVLHLIQRIRDEAHRFALSYHKNLRDKL